MNRSEPGKLQFRNLRRFESFRKKPNHDLGCDLNSNDYEKQSLVQIKNLKVGIKSNKKTLKSGESSKNLSTSNFNSPTNLTGKYCLKSPTKNRKISFNTENENNEQNVGKTEKEAEQIDDKQLQPE